MGRCNQFLKLNSGFSLIELLVAIAIIAMLTVPLLNSFTMAGKTTKDSRNLQNATAVAQSVVEGAKRTSDPARLSVVLSGIKDVSNLVKTSPEGGAVWSYSMNVEGADGEDFKVDLSLTPKTDYDYKNTDFADIYNEANVIYSELVLYDNNILSLIRSADIPYDTENAPLTFKWDSAAGVWTAWTPEMKDKALRQTYGNLLADEYSGADIPGEVNPVFTEMNEKFVKENIEKQVNIMIEQSGNDYVVTINTVYTIENYQVVYRDADSTVPAGPLPSVPPEDEEGTPAPAVPSGSAFYMYMGTIVYEAKPIVLTFDNDKPIYMLYAKSKGISYTPEGIRVVDPRYFKSVVYTIAYDAGVALTDVGGTPKNIELYLVEQGGTLTDNTVSFKVVNGSSVSGLDIYTTEEYGTGMDTIETATTGRSVNVYSSRDIHNTDNHVAYKKTDTITALYKITALVYYDENRDGNYTDDEMVYSVTTED